MFDKNKLIAIMSVVLLCSVFVVTALFSSCDKKREENDLQEKMDNVELKGDGNNQEKDVDYTIVIDAGHGGVDPGKVGISGQLEKDINLQIATKLKNVLEQNKDIAINVVLTRDSDMGHYTDSDSNKKSADMKKRCEIVNSAGADILVSIHQNSYHSQSVKGAQVFYYEQSKEGNRLAKSIQEELVLQLVKEGKGRVEKANDNYYMLLNVECPAVIVECGFLSNKEEADKLSSEEYQEKVAKAIADGVISYLNQ